MRAKPRLPSTNESGPRWIIYLMCCLFNNNQRRTETTFIAPHFFFLLGVRKAETKGRTLLVFKGYDVICEIWYLIENVRLITGHNAKLRYLRHHHHHSTHTTLDVNFCWINPSPLLLADDSHSVIGPTISRIERQQRCYCDILWRSPMNK